jgi:hypothetical protein
MELKIPFKNTGGNKNIYNKQELDLGLKLKNLDLFHFIDDIKKTDVNENNSNSDINIIKASQTKNYYKNIKKNIK